MKLKEIFDQSDTIIEPWPDFEANCFRVGGPCRSAFRYFRLAKPCRLRMTMNQRGLTAVDGKSKLRYIPGNSYNARILSILTIGTCDFTFKYSLGPRPFFEEEKRPGAICSRMREKLRKITVKSLVYVEIKYTAEVFGTRLLFHVYIHLGYTDRIRENATG